MSVFEYLAALVSVVVGLAVAQTLGGILKLVHHRDTTRPYWVPFVWTASLIAWTVFFWWFTFSLSGLVEWRMRDLLFVLSYAAFIYFLLGLLFPDEIRADFDMRQHFGANRSWFFGTLLCLGVFEVVDTWIKLSSELLPPTPFGMTFYGSFMAVWLVGSAAATRARSPRYDAVFAVGFFILAVIYMVGTAGELFNVS